MRDGNDGAEAKPIYAGLAFLLIIITSLFLSLIFGAIIGSGSLSFYNISLFSIILYAMFMGVFVGFWKFGRFRVQKGRAEPGQFNSGSIYFSRPTVRDIYLTVLIGLCALAGFLLLQNLVLEIFVLMNYQVPDSHVALNTPWRFIIATVTLAILPSVVEELLFRGIILHALLPLGKWKAVLLSSAMFSLFHLSPAQTVYQFVLGVFMALVYLRTRNIFIPILLHFVNNFTTIVILFAGYGTDLADNESFRLGAFTIIGAIVLAITSTFVILNLVRAIKNREGTLRERHKLKIEEGFLLGLGIGLALIIWFMAFIPSTL